MSELNISLVTASTGEPVTLAEAKEHLYVTSDQFNETIRRKLQAAVDYCQRKVGGHRQFMPATYDLILDEFPDEDDDEDQKLEFPLPPLKNVVYVKYYNSSGTLTNLGSTLGATASTTAYTMVKPQHDPGFIVPAFGDVWPTAREVPNAVTVRFTAGYASAAAVPASVKEAVLIKLEQLWDPERIGEDTAHRVVTDLLNAHSYGHY